MIGGYIAALLLRLLHGDRSCVSARTDNQIVSLMVTLTIGGALYLIGAPAFTDFFGTKSEVLRSIGTGSRFESTSAASSIFVTFLLREPTAFFLVLNTYFLESKRMKHNRKGPSQERQPYDSGCSV